MKKMLIICSLVLAGLLHAETCYVEDKVQHPEEEAVYKIHGVCIDNDLYYGTFRKDEKDVVELTPAIKYNGSVPTQKKCICANVQLVDSPAK